MKEVDTAFITAKSRSWPTPQDYNEAIQHPQWCFVDDELRTCNAAIDKLGLPRPVTGAFASVYHMSKGEKSYALRCFLHNVRDQETRYEHISRYVMNDDLPYTVPCDFQKKGIRINGEWFPVLKMEWVSGVTLERYIHQHLHHPNELRRLQLRFRTMCDALKEAGIAHGDLQHGNIMVLQDGELRLVDYDGLYVPSMKGWKSNEIGHRNYQHPARAAAHFGPELDNFAMWVIDLSIAALAEEPAIFEELGVGIDCLTLKKTDFELPWESHNIARLERISPSIKTMCNSLKHLLLSDPLAVLDLGSDSPEVLPPARYANIPAANTNDWWQDFDVAGRRQRKIEKVKNQHWQLSAQDLKQAAKNKMITVEPELQSNKLPRHIMKNQQGLAFYPNKARIYSIVLFSSITFVPLCALGPWCSVQINLLYILFCVIASLFTYFWTWANCIERNLLMFGNVAMGQITDTRITKETDGEGFTTTKYFLDYDFTIVNASGALETIYSSLQCKSFLNMQVGQNITIVYSNQNPKKNIIYKLSRYRVCTRRETP